MVILENNGLFFTKPKFKPNFVVIKIKKSNQIKWLLIVNLAKRTDAIRSFIKMKKKS